jgi:HAD superfamily hydrolase (TIGR01509 family)
MSRYGLIFDVDGVIADTEGINARVTAKVLAELFGIQGVIRSDFEAGLGRGPEPYIRVAAQIHGRQLNAEEIQRATELRQEYILKTLKQEGLPVFAGVRELMESAMSSEDFQVAIATSGSLAKSRGILKAAKIPFEKMVYITGDKVKHKKPNPELFLLASKGLGIEPRNCVVIEDTPAGVEAAKAAGSKCIAVTNSVNASALSQADMICESLEQIDIETLRNLLVTK